MSFLVFLFVVALASQQCAAQIFNTNTYAAETVNTNVPQHDTQNKFFVTFDFEGVAPTCCPGALPSCGDGKCNRTENCETCPQDCGCEFCGDGLCLKTDHEDCHSCPKDCGKCTETAVCGDGICTEGFEACGNCQVDCGKCDICGDKVCSITENCDSCPLDCGGACPSGALVGGTVDILTDLPIPGAIVETVNVRPTSEYFMRTNEDGNFLFHLLPVQIVELKATHPQYGVATVSVQIPLNGVANVTIYMAPALPENAWRVRLTWGRLPTDLDLTMFGDWGAPYSNGVVNWESPTKINNLPWATYIGDINTGYGPETIDILQFGAPKQNVEFWVHNYSGDRKNASEALRLSPARVIAFTGSRGMQGDWTLNTTNLKGTETWWHVFDITPSQEVVFVNQFFSLVSAAPCGYVDCCPYRPMDLFLRRKK